MLEHDGKRINQLISIMTYLGKLHGYYPEDPYEAWRVDSFIEGIQDLMNPLIIIKRETDKEQQMKLFMSYFGTTLPTILRALDKRVGGNSNPNYAVGDKLTTADFVFCSIIFSIFYNEKFEFAVHFKASFENFANLKTYAGYHSENTFKEYLATRP